ncbi:retrovirus-related pol polyprotein from transposon TNT 1-94 [Tanacetum coccineum]
MDENGVVIKNKARLVAQGFRQEEGIGYDETFSPDIRLEAIGIFLAYDAYMGFMVYQMDVKNAFLNGKISEEVCIQQPPGFESSELPNHVCKLDKALYGLKQAPRAWYETLSKFLIQNKFVIVCWSAKKQSSIAMSSVEAEYVVAASCCAQVLWIKSQLADYDVLYDKVPIFCDNTSAIAISNNLVLHSRTKHIDIRYHFIRDHIIKGDIELHFIPTDMQLADIFTKPLAEPSFTRLVAELGMLNLEKEVPNKKKALSDPLTGILNVFKMIAYGLCCGLDIDIARILFLDLVVKLTIGKKGRDLNICYTRYLSLIIEHLLGDAYKNDNLKTMKPHQITASSFKPSTAFEGVNVDDTADKSLSGTVVQPVTQSKAPTDKKSKKNKNPTSSKLKTSKTVKESSLTTKFADTQYVEIWVLRSPFDTKSKIKFDGKEKDFLDMNDYGIEINLIGSSRDPEFQEGDSDLESMPDNEIESVSGFEADTDDDQDNHSKHKEELSKYDEVADDNVIDELVDMAHSQDTHVNASADNPAQSYPLRHLHADISLLSTKVENLESSLAQQVANKIEDSMLRMMADAFKERMPKLLADTLKNILPHIIKDSVKQALSKFDKRGKKTLKAQVPDIVLKLLYREFNALNKEESRRFVTLQKHLSKAIHKIVGKSVQRNVKKQIGIVNKLLKWNAKNQLMLIKYLEEMVHSPVRILRDIMVVNAKHLQTKVEKNAVDILELLNLIQEFISLIDPILASPKATTEGEKISTQQQTDHGEQSSEQAHPTSTALVIQTLREEPRAKKLKFTPEDFPIPSPTPLNSIIPPVIRPPVIINNIPFEQFSASLFSLSSSEFSPTPHPKAADKGKGKAQKTSEDDQMKQLMPLLEQGGSTLKISNLHQFSAAEEGPLTIEKARAQMEEIKRLADLKAKKEKSEKRLKVLTVEELKAHAAELDAYEAEKAKMLKEYNHYISFRVDPLPITKISYRVNNSTKKATMRITRNNQPLNYKINDKFVLKMLCLSEWLEVFDVVSKNQNKSNDQLLKNLKANFQWVVTQAGKLGIPPPPEITAFEFPLAEKKTGTKRKRMAEVIHELFVKENVVVDGMHRKLVLPARVVGSLGLVIDESEARIFV